MSVSRKIIDRTEYDDEDLIKSKDNLHSIYFINRYNLPLRKILMGLSEFGRIHDIVIVEHPKGQRTFVYYTDLEDAKRTVKGLRGQRSARLRPHPKSINDDDEEEDDDESIKWEGCSRKLFPDD